MARTIESDVVVLGAGISAAMLAEKLSETGNEKILVVEAGNKIFNLDERTARRERFLAYGENPWPNDHVRGQTAKGITSRTMAVGGLALHWGGTTPRYTPEDFRVHSLYGIGYDWPFTYDDLEPFYFEAEERLGVAGTPGPPELDPRIEALSASRLPADLQPDRAEEMGGEIGNSLLAQPGREEHRSLPGPQRLHALRHLQHLSDGSEVHPGVHLPEASRGEEDRSRRAHARPEAGAGRGLGPHRPRRRPRSRSARRARRDPREDLRPRLRLLLELPPAAALRERPVSRRPREPFGARGEVRDRPSAGARFPRGPAPALPGDVRGRQPSLEALPASDAPGRYMRHDLRIWESSYGRNPRLQDDQGGTLLGDAMLDDWRKRSQTGAARMRAYYDVIPARDSAITLDSERKNPWGDPLPRIDFVDSDWSKDLREHTEGQIRAVYEKIAAAGDGKILSLEVDDKTYDHPGGGCRMGADPATSVVDPFGRAHDHENLWVVGAPTIVSVRLQQRHSDLRGAHAANGFGDEGIMRKRILPLVLVLAAGLVQGQERIVLRAGRLLDGTGSVLENRSVVVEGGKIREIGAAGRGDYDLSGLTVLPGLIDTHVHIASHFDLDDRVHRDESVETPQENALYAAENGYRTSDGGHHHRPEPGQPGRQAAARCDRPGHPPRSAHPHLAREHLRHHRRPCGDARLRAGNRNDRERTSSRSSPPRASGTEAARRSPRSSSTPPAGKHGPSAFGPWSTPTGRRAPGAPSPRTAPSSSTELFSTWKP